MKLSTKQRNKLEEFISKYFQEEVRCQVCQNTSWNVEATIFKADEFFLDKVVIGSGSTFPFFPVVCTQCGYALIFNAIAVGLFSDDNPKKEDEDNG